MKFAIFGILIHITCFSIGSCNGTEEEYEKFLRHANSGDAMPEAFVRGAMGDPFGKAIEVSSAEKRLVEKLEDAKRHAWISSISSKTP